MITIGDVFRARLLLFELVYQLLCLCVFLPCKFPKCMQHVAAKVLGRAAGIVLSCERVGLQPIKVGEFHSDAVVVGLSERLN